MAVGYVFVYFLRQYQFINRLYAFVFIWASREEFTVEFIGELIYQ